MRFAVGAGLVLLIGCNRIFGITETRLWDAPVDVIEDMPHVALTWQVAAVTSTGAPAPIEYPAIDPAMAPVVRIATLDGPFQPAEYRTSADQPGWIPIPREFEHTTWRLEYVLPDPDPVRGAPHEVQWAPDQKQGYLTVPVVGRATTESVPVGSGYQLTVPASLTMPAVFTTGLWSVSKQVTMTTTQPGSMVDYDFSNAAWLGRRGRLVGSQGDHALLVDFVADSGCRVASGGGELPTGSVDLKPGEHTSATVTLDMTRQPLMSPGVSFDFQQRLFMALGKRHATFQPAQSFRLFGVVPSLSFPGLMGSAPNQILPVPVMLTLLQCQYDKPLPLPATAQPLPGFPTVLHVQLIDSRNLTLLRDGGGTTSVTLNSGIETVLPSTREAGVTTFQMAFPAAIATNIKLTTPAGVLDLADGPDQHPDQQDAGPPSGLFLLDFVPESPIELRADYHDVILHRITDAALVPVRVYTVTQPHVRIDATPLAGNADYVFEIRTYKGHPRASHGDFRPVDYPYGAAIVFSRTFRTASR